jgi:DNA-binding transcriptional ArsR family regulator
LVGGSAAALVWGLLRWFRSPRSSAPPAGGNGAGDPQISVGATEPARPHPGSTVRGGSPVSVSSAQVRLSERVVVLLAREGRLGEDSVVRPVRTQAGLAAALDSNQSAVSKVLRRLAAAELLTEERRHVQGRNPRLKVYALSRRGEVLAREVARRRNLSLLPERRDEGSDSLTGETP